MPSSIESFEGVHQLAEPALIQADGKCIDGKITTVLIILQCAVFHDGLARIVAVALTASAHKLHLHLSHLHLGGAEIAENRKVGLSPQLFLQAASHIDAAAHDHHVDVFRWPFQEDIANEAAHDIAFYSQFVGRIGNQMEYVFIEYFC